MIRNIFVKILVLLQLKKITTHRVHRLKNRKVVFFKYVLFEKNCLKTTYINEVVVELNNTKKL